MTYDFPYLKDSSFLKSFDSIKLKEQLVKLVVLTFDELPIQEIQGKIVSGSLSLDGSSGMRRTCNLTMIADDYENDLTDTKHLLSINKKIELLIGFINNTNQYKDYPILWFPQGVFVIISPNISHSSQGINISLTLHDKMALLNGQCGGVLPASVIFSEVEDIDENGDIQIRQPVIYQIIQELVNHFGGQQLGKIIISDLDNKIKKVMRWIGSIPLYMYKKIDEQGKFYYHITTNQGQVKADVNNKKITWNDVSTYSYGQDVGYILTDFVYPGDLISNAGDTVVTILDQIKNVLGNYEYFYDVYGNFHFQEIKNYLNTSYSTTKLSELNMNDYLVEYVNGKSVYTFEDGEIIQSYQNTPQYQQIKNDFMVWGKRTTIEGNEIPIRYHLAIDKKPTIIKGKENKYKVFFFIDPDDNVLKAKKPQIFNTINQFPAKGQVGQYYMDSSNNIIYKWAADVGNYESTSYTIQEVAATDYRTELYLSGVNSQPFGLDSNYYYTELKNQWPKLYNIRGDNPDFKQQVQNHPSDIDFFLDLIDTQAALGEFSVQNIGRRTTTLVDDSINCIFEPEIPNIVIIDISSDDAVEIRNKCWNQKQDYAQVRPQIYSMLIDGGTLRSAYEEIRKELYQYTNYNQQVSLTTIPIYYLEPNTRITIRDNESGIYGDYIIKNISLPLDINSMMNISCTRAVERI